MLVGVFYSYTTHKQTHELKPPPPVENENKIKAMKTLDKKATEILRALLALQTAVIDNMNGAYMPIHIELIDRTENYHYFSLAHYGQQNGDMMRDPEMLFALHKESQQFIPYYYRNDYCGIEQYSIKWTAEGVLLNRRLQADHTTFANQWLRNIAAQQHIL